MVHRAIHETDDDDEDEDHDHDEEDEGETHEDSSSAAHDKPQVQIASLFQGYGTHYADLWCGSPARQRQTVIVDTGSGVTALRPTGQSTGPDAARYFRRHSCLLA